MFDELKRILISERSQTLGVFSGPRADDFVLVGEVERGVLTSDSTADAIFCPDFFWNSRQPLSWRAFKALHRIPKTQVKTVLHQIERVEFDAVFKVPEGQSTAFKAEVLEVQRKIKETNLRKAVPYAFALADRSPNRQEQLGMLAACFDQQEKSGGYVYGLLDSSSGVLGLTPELILEKKDQKLRTVALAGTRRFSAAAEIDLLNDPKDREEHDFVVQGIAQALQLFGQVGLAETKTRRSAGLIHLETEIELLGASASFGAVLDCLHPTPALGGFPKEEARQWLKDFNLKQPRSRFGAPFVVRAGEHEVGVVSIRGIEWSSQFCRMGAGCGVVEKSNPDSEWQELTDKWASICQSMGLKLEVLC